MRQMNKVLQTALAMTETFPTHQYPLEWICKVCHRSLTV